MPKTTEVTTVPDPFVGQRNEVVATANAFKITTPKADEAAVAFLRDVVKPLKEKIEAHFAPHKKRAHETWRGLCEDEKNALAPLAEVRALIEARVLEFRRKEEERRRAKEAELQKALAAKAEPDEAPPVAHVPSRVREVENVHTRSTWTFEVVDMTKMKNEFIVCSVNERAIAEIVRRLGPQAEAVVGGIRVFEKQGLVVR